jgi:ABC-type lipoprotein release transport system permease subunit
MARILPLAQRPTNKHSDRLSASVTLAFWRLRQTWLLLLMAGVGFVAAMVIACAVPLFSAVVAPTGLQTVFQASPTRDDLTLSASTQRLSTPVVSALQQQLVAPLRKTLDLYHPTLSPLTIQEDYFQVLSPAALRHIAPLRMYATALESLEPHLRLVAGRWPAGSTPGEMEILLTPQAAQELHLSLGAALTLQGQFHTSSQLDAQIDPAARIAVRLVGLFEVPPASLTFLHGQTFQPASDGVSILYTFLAPASAFLSTLDQIAARAHIDAIFSDLAFQLTWDAYLHTDHVQPGQFDELVNQLSSAQTAVSNYQNGEQQLTASTVSFPYVSQASLYNPTPGSFQLLDLLRQYRSRTTQVSIPLVVLTLQIIALLLFFVCILIGMLLDRQMAANALLSSRGASSGQIFWSLFTQGIGLCLLGALLGPLLGLALVSTLAMHILPAGSQSAVQQTLGQPLRVLAAIGPTSGGALLAALLAVGLIVRYTTGLNLLTLRRETARVTRAPFWQRYYLDVLAAVIALSAYGVSLYLASVAHEVDVTTQNLLLAPLTLVAPIFLLLGFLLLFMRVFPWLLRLGGWSASRRRGAVSMLALVQIARAPRQIIRMTLLLSLTVAFAVFALVFNASQARRITDISSYETGADFSGTLPASLGTQPMSSILARYRAIPGVLAATADFSDNGTVLGSGNTSITVKFYGIDTRSFASAVIWGPQDSSQPLQSLQSLLPRAQQGISSLDNPTGILIPSIIDQALANQLQVHVGDTFSMTLNDLQQSSLVYRVAAIVAHIPTVNSSTIDSASGSPGGMLVDYTVFTHSYIAIWNAQQEQQNLVRQQKQHLIPPPPVPINHIWLRTSEDEHSLASVRAALNASPLALSNLYDRREITAELRSDPFTLNILLILVIGSLVAFLLAFGGNLLSSWVSVSTRRGSFVVLRALGATSRHIAGILLWEQGIVYLGAIVLGLSFGAVLARVAVPVLVFTGLPAHGPMSLLSSDDFYFLQRVFPPRIVVPGSLSLVVLALVAICLAALVTTIRTALRPSVSSELRLNED